jgi:hypothetical protein
MVIDSSTLAKSDIPAGPFKWATFSTFALTFDPRKEDLEDSERFALSAVPEASWSVRALRCYLYSWQRIGNNQGVPSPEVVGKIEKALEILRSKV